MSMIKKYLKKDILRNISKKIPKERYISSEEAQKIIDNLDVNIIIQ